ncbi:hypothetical protein Tco_0582060 [Tanacetum coccineum]
MEITVVTLVEEQMSSWKGNLPKLPIIIKYSAIGTRKYSGRYLGNNISGIQLEKHLHSWFKHGNLIDGKSISSESNGLVTQPGDFAPTAVLTKFGIVSISAARQSFSRAVAPVSADRPINTAAPKPFVNVTRTRLKAFHMSHSPSRTPFNQQITLKNRNLNERVNTAKVNSVNTVKGNKVTSVVGKQCVGNYAFLN